MYWINRILIANIFICIVLVAGCVKLPVSKYEQLNTSTQDLSFKVSDTYSRIKKVQRRYIITQAPDTAINENTFHPVLMGISLDLSPELDNRAAALDLISKYSNVLFVFSSKDYLKDVDHASTNLAASVRTFNKTTLYRNSNQSSIIGSAFGILADVAGKQLIDKKRLKMLKLSMDSTQKYIVILSNLLIKDNQRFEKALDEWRNSILRHANAVRPQYATLGRYEFDLDMANLLDEIADIKQTLKNTNDALVKLPIVFSDIRSLLDKKDVKMEALQDLISEGQRLSTVYNNLNK